MTLRDARGSSLRDSARKRSKDTGKVVMPPQRMAWVGVVLCLLSALASIFIIGILVSAVLRW